METKINPNEFKKDAASGAKKLCNQNCIASCVCENPRLRTCGMRPVVPNTPCPIAKYNAYAHASDEWWKIPAKDQYVNEAEIFALCALCDNTGDIAKEGDHLTLKRTDLSKCMDCPVKMAEEDMQENAAEAAMS